MAWRFRKSFRVIPGVRLNVSSRGVTATIGGSPLSLNVGSNGTFANINLPGTGLSYRERLSSRESEVVPPVVPISLPAQPGRVEIQSASTYELASEALSQFQRLLADASHEQGQLDTEIAAIAPEASAQSERAERWRNGLVLRRILKKKFQEIEARAEDSAAHLAELREQRRLTSIATQIEIADVLRRPFGRLCDAFSIVAECQRIWDTLAVQRTDRFRERTTADHSIERKPVRFELSTSDLLTCEWNVPKLANANGGDLYLYPGFVLYRVSRQSFAVIDVREITVNVGPSRFIEEEGVPSDSETVGETWKRANKDGSPDRRFANNYRIPIVEYGQIAFTTPSGLNEIYLLSKYGAAEDFGKAWQAYAATFEFSTKTPANTASVVSHAVLDL